MPIVHTCQFRHKIRFIKKLLMYIEYEFNISVIVSVKSLVRGAYDWFELNELGVWGRQYGVIGAEIPKVTPSGAVVVVKDVLKELYR